MKKTLVTSVALAACVTTQLFAQNVKEDTMTLSFTVQGQSSVSESKTAANSGTWTNGYGPQYYKTATTKMTQTDVLRAISYVLHGGNANYYSSSAKLVLVQGELSGFFNVNTNLAAVTRLGGTNNVKVWDTNSFVETSSTITDLVIPKLATGRNFDPNPKTGSWPVGHHQPWGQIFVKDPTKSLCENVTFFFNVTVQECYDCYYLNSYITDTSFTGKFVAGKSSGPPCCSTPSTSTIGGSGKDRYYLTLSFDNTENNPYLTASSGVLYTGYQGIQFSTIPGDGVDPDMITYVDYIKSGLGTPQQYVMRWTLNGIMTYAWTLKTINTGDAAQDFVGTGVYPANGYGFIALVCSLLNGTTTMTEKIVSTKTTFCCSDMPWYNSWYGAGALSGEVLSSFGPPTVDGYPDAAGATTPVNLPVDLTSHVDYNQAAPRISAP